MDEWIHGTHPPIHQSTNPTIPPMILLDSFDTTKPELMPPSPLPICAPFKLVITTNADPAELIDTVVVQGLILTFGDVVLLIGQTDPTQNGFWSVGSDTAVRVVDAAFFCDAEGHYRQFKTGVHEGTNGQWDSTDANYSTNGEFDPAKVRAGKHYFLATPAPALFEDGLLFYELTASTPHLNNAGNYDLTPPQLRPLDTDAPYDATYVCKVAADDNQEFGPGAIGTLDGVDLVEGDYFLLKGQETQGQNGVYVVVPDGQDHVTGLVRARITAGTNAGKQFSVNQATGVVTSLAPGVIT
jgi:hypothetical protein